MASSVPIHEAVYDAIVARDSVKARRAMETILTLASSQITRVYLTKLEKHG